LVLDEPFSGLDVTTSLIFRAVLNLLAQSGKAIFFCSPVLEVVEKFAHTSFCSAKDRWSLTPRLMRSEERE
jgi:ABC-type multidrug transport system ATPase subunit